MKTTKNKKAGFTLIEVMLAMVIFIIGALVIARLQGTVARGNADARRLSEATKIAREIVEEMNLLRTFYRPAGDEICQFVPFEITYSNNSPIATPLAVLDPEAAEQGIDRALERALLRIGIRLRLRQ